MGVSNNKGFTKIPFISKKCFPTHAWKNIGRSNQNGLLENYIFLKLYRKKTLK